MLFKLFNNNLITLILWQYFWQNRYPRKESEMKFKTVFLKKYTTDKTDMKIASYTVYIVGLFIFGLGIFILVKLAESLDTLDILPFLIILAFLILCIFFLQMILMGLIMEVLSKIQQLEDKIKG